MGDGPITVDVLCRVIGELELAGFAADDIAWSENIKPPATAEDFALEAIFVICNSGMKNTVARGIYDRIVPLLERGESSWGGFKHPGKVAAIDTIWANRQSLHACYMVIETPSMKLEYLAGLPWIGDITKYHLAKNFGADVAKPDVHLQRLADLHGITAQQLCEGLAREIGYRVATVDLLIWRACAIGVIDSRTGRVRAWSPPPVTAQADLFARPPA